MAAGKRLSTTEPLTEHDVADRLDKAALRVWRIMLDTRQQSPEFYEAVRHSRYLTNVIPELRKEMDTWFPRKEESSCKASAVEVVDAVSE